MTALSSNGLLLAMEVSPLYFSSCIILHLSNEDLTGLFGSVKTKDEGDCSPAMILRQRLKVKAPKWQKSDSGAALLFGSNTMNYGQSTLIKFPLKILPGSGRHRLSFRQSKGFR